MILAYSAIALLVVATVYSALVGFRRLSEDERSWIFPQAPSRSARIAAGILTLAFSTALGMWLYMGSHHSMSRSARFLIPEGYTGWVRVEFDVQGAAPLPEEGGDYVLKIPSAGILQTSSPEQYGWARDRYYYYSVQGQRSIPDSGQGELIWGKINGEEVSSAGKRKYEEFFVGTAQQFRDQSR